SLARPLVLLVLLEPLLGRDARRHRQLPSPLLEDGGHHPLVAVVVHAEVAGDGGDEGPERAAGGVAIPRHPGPEERLLGDLFGVRRVAQLAPAVLHQRGVAALVELGEGLVARSLLCALPAIELY